MKKFAVIVAAGSGSRMGAGLPKQFIELLGTPVLIHSVNAFAAAYPDITIVLVVHPSYREQAQQMIDKAGYSANTIVVTGAATRSGSVRQGLARVPDDSIVMVHDAARCTVSGELIRRCVEQAIRTGSAIPAVSLTDSIRIITGEGSKPMDRNLFRLVQTPQTFKAKQLKDAYASTPDNDFTDDAAVFENAGYRITLIEGEATNIKITHPGDIAIAELILKGKRSALK